MNRALGLVVIVLTVAVWVGCGKKGIDTGRLQSSFKSAPPAAQSDVDKAVTAIKAGNYSQAMSDLQQVAAQAKLTPEQQQAIQDVMAQVHQQVSDAANKAAKDLQKTVGDLKKSLPGQ